MSEMPRVHLFRPDGPDRVAMVSIQPATQAGSYLIQVARGPKRTKLAKGGSFGPVPESLIVEKYAGIIGALRLEGFRTAGFSACITALKHKDAGVRARAAVRLGWMREPEAVDALLDVLPKAVDDVCSIVDALGALGDPRAIPAVRAHAARKLLSRRRSGAEALRNLGDSDGLAEVKNRALERMPSSVRGKLEGTDEANPSDEAVEALVEAVLAVAAKDRGLVIDSLYEIATPAAVRATRRALLRTEFEKPHLWRYTKSVYKRAALRKDFETLGLIAHAVEARGRASTGTTAKVKSGYDGTEKKTRIFGRATQGYMRRAAWRYLRKLARYAPRSYAPAAAEMIIPYEASDLVTPSGRYGALADAYVLVRVLYGGSDRFELDSRKMKWAFRSAKKTEPPTNVREEAFPSLWDEEPRAYLRVLTAAKLIEAHQFAAPSVAGEHRRVLNEASAEEVIALVDAPYELTVKLGVQELERRFDPTKPDFKLLWRLLASKVQAARDLGLSWLRQTAPIWTDDIQQIVAFLRVPDGPTRALAVELVVARAPAMSPALREELTAEVLRVLRAAEATPGDHDAFARVARGALMDELGALLETSELLHFITSGSSASKAVAGDLLGRRQTAMDEIGIERVVALAQSEVSAVRAAAHALVRGAIDRLKSEPSLLFMLVESEWEDTRAFAFELLRTAIDIPSLGLDGLIGLCDSNLVDVQEVGKELVEKNLREGAPGVSPDEVLSRLVQHPHPNMRAFALDLAERYLGSGTEELSKVQRLSRAILFDLWPKRRVKHKMIDLLIRRGQRSAEEATIAASILSDYVRTKGRDDFERVMEGLVRIGLEFPGVASAVRLLVGGDEGGSGEPKQGTREAPAAGSEGKAS